MTIHLTIEGEDGNHIRHQMAQVLGLRLVDDGLAGRYVNPTTDRPAGPKVESVMTAPQPPVDNEHVAEGAEPFSPEVIAANAPKRERGKPSPGHARRTKAEIAEDEAFLAAAGKELADVMTTATEAAAPVVEDAPEVQAADAADEAAETAANKPADAPPTVEDIRNVLGLYQKIYGIAACMEDGPAILQEVCGQGVVKVSSVPEDKIADVIAALKKAGNDNRFQRAQVAS